MCITKKTRFAGGQLCCVVRMMIFADARRDARHLDPDLRRGDDGGRAVIAGVRGGGKCGADCEDVGAAPAASNEGRGKFGDATEPHLLDRRDRR